MKDDLIEKLAVHALGMFRDDADVELSEEAKRLFEETDPRQILRSARTVSNENTSEINPPISKLQFRAAAARLNDDGTYSEETQKSIEQTRRKKIEALEEQNND